MKTDKKIRLRKLAIAIRQEYIRCRRRFESSRTGIASNWRPGPVLDGSEDRLGNKHKPIWPQIAKCFCDNKINALDYINACFWNAKFSPPTPKQLMAAKNLDWYQESQRMAAEEAETIFKSMCEFCKTEILRSPFKGPNKEAMTAVLLDDDLPLSALFRYCLAINEDVEIVAATYKAQAVLEYMRNPELYDAVWGDAWIPKRFRDEAETLWIGM